jgi:riboflavin biosynthesis pyrimidine reductase
MRILMGPGAGREELSDEELVSLYAAPHRPWLRVNMVSSLDGSATGTDGRTGSINNAPDYRVFHLLRGMADAIVVGAGTARAEGYGPTSRPIVVVTRSGSVPQKLRSAERGAVLLATVAHAEHLEEARGLLGEENVLVLGSHRVSLLELKEHLVARGFADLLCEGGPHLLRDLVDQGVADELTMTLVPRLVAGLHPRITDGPPVDAPLTMSLLLEEGGTLLGRWFTA